VILTLRILHGILGLAAIGICLSILILGPSATAGFSEAQFNAVTGSSYPPTGPWPATMDNELRFYAPFWGAYGLVLLAIARDMSAKLRYVPTMALLFFVGGVGRGLSYMSVGAPHPFFTALMAVELLLPLLFLALWRGARP
jgi:hypothetical protein